MVDVWQMGGSGAKGPPAAAARTLTWQAAASSSSKHKVLSDMAGMARSTQEGGTRGGVGRLRRVDVSALVERRPGFPVRLGKHCLFLGSCAIVWICLLQVHRKVGETTSASKSR